MDLNRCIESFFLGVALVLVLLSEREDVPHVPRFSCKAVDDAWRQYRTGFTAVPLTDGLGGWSKRRKA